MVSSLAWSIYLFPFIAASTLFDFSVSIKCWRNNFFATTLLMGIELPTLALFVMRNTISLTFKFWSCEQRWGLFFFSTFHNLDAKHRILDVDSHIMQWKGWKLHLLFIWNMLKKVMKKTKTPKLESYFIFSLLQRCYTKNEEIFPSHIQNILLFPQMALSAQALCRLQDPHWLPPLTFGRLW